MRAVQGSKRKWNCAAPSTWPATVVGEHAHGTWVEMPKGTAHVRDDGTVWAQTFTAVALVPPSGRWHGLFFDFDGSPTAYVDLCESVSWTTAGYLYEDLYLDLIISPAGEVTLDDADELEEAVDLGHLTAAHARRVHDDAEVAAALFLADGAVLLAEGLERLDTLMRRRAAV